MNQRNLDQILVAVIVAFAVWWLFKPKDGAYVFSEEWEVKVPVTPQPRRLP